jgi:hypothetical protein
MRAVGLLSPMGVVRLEAATASEGAAGGSATGEALRLYDIARHSSDPNPGLG